jgi:hypothetical protein
MSITTPKIVDELTLVKFAALGTTYIKTAPEAKSFVEGFEKTTHAASLKFADLVISRSFLQQTTPLDQMKVTFEGKKEIVINQTNSKVQHGQLMIHIKGPLTSKQFIQLMQFKEGISNEAWSEHIERFSLIQPKL